MHELQQNPEKRYRKLPNRYHSSMHRKHQTRSSDLLYFLPAHTWGRSSVPDHCSADIATLPGPLPSESPQFQIRDRSLACTLRQLLYYRVSINHRLTPSTTHSFL